MLVSDDDTVYPWCGSADQLYEVISMSGTRNSQQRFAKTCPNPRILISQLRTLESRYPERVGYSRRLPNQPDKLQGREYWRILPEGYVEPDDNADVLGDLM